MTAVNFDRCTHVANGGAQCCLESGHEGRHRYKCCGLACPGLLHPASEHPHPPTCNLDGRMPAESVRVDDRNIPHGQVRLARVKAARERDGEVAAELADSILRVKVGELTARELGLLVYAVAAELDRRKDTEGRWPNLRALARGIVSYGRGADQTH